MEDQIYYYQEKKKLSKNSYVRTWYTFLWWKKNNGTSIWADEYEMKKTTKSDLTIYAQWKINQYTIIFSWTDIAPITGDYGTAVVAPTDIPTKSGFVFAWWDPEIAEVSGDATYIATFTEEKNKYRIVFENGGFQWARNL